MAALKRMQSRDRGTIVEVGSAMAYRGIPLQAPYCGAKHAIKGFVESMRCELRNKKSNVHVTMVQLPGLNTPQFDHCRSKMPKHPMPVPPIYQPEVAADAVHWAAHHRRREVWVGLPTVYTIIGNRLAPWLAELYLAKTAVNGQQTDAAAERRRTRTATSSPRPVATRAPTASSTATPTATRFSGGPRATAGPWGPPRSLPSPAPPACRGRCLRLDLPPPPLAAPRSGALPGAPDLPLRALGGRREAATRAVRFRTTTVVFPLSGGGSGKP